jgi:hypothetical protein
LKVAGVRAEIRTAQTPNSRTRLYHLTALRSNTVLHLLCCCLHTADGHICMVTRFLYCVWCSKTWFYFANVNSKLIIVSLRSTLFLICKFSFSANSAKKIVFFFEIHLHEFCVLLGYYAAWSGSCVPAFRDNLSAPLSRVLDFLILEDGTDRLSLNVGTELPLNAA